MCLTTTTKTFKLFNNADAVIFGVNDANLELLAEQFQINIHPFGDHVDLQGEKASVNLVAEILKHLVNLLHSGIQIGETDVISAARMAQADKLDYFEDLYNQVLLTDAKGKPIRVRNLGQRKYIQTIKHHDITFGIGPAGTGKTYLAVVMAVSALKKGQVQRLVLTRPAVEAGENLGFLPGDLKEKVDPYLRPVYDVLDEILGADQSARLIDHGVIEVAPLAYMRGRTLNNSFIILDEAQNTTSSQMKMFLTRLGLNSKMIVNGDISQIDLPSKVQSGLLQASKILKDIKGIGFISFSSKDVVRHQLVTKIIEAYEKEGR